MTSMLPSAIAAALVAGVLGLTAAPAASQAQPAPGCTSPPGMSYMICNGQRVPKPGSRVVADDGSWREESRQGNCIVVREKSASGEYKESRRCD